MAQDALWSMERCVANYKAQLVLIIAALFKLARIVPSEVHDPNDPEIWNICLPRYCYKRVLEILQPAESALRRLIIMAADGKNFVPDLPTVPSAKTDGDEKAHETMAPESLVPESECVSQDSLSGQADIDAGMPSSPSDALEATPSSPRPPVFDMFDPMKKFGFCGFYEQAEWEALQAHRAANPVIVPQADPLKRMDPVNALSLWKRIHAIHHALENFDTYVTRHIRWKGTRGFQMKNNLPVTGRKRNCLMRPGYAPGYVRKGKHEVHDVLRNVHILACHSLSSPDPLWDGG